MKFLCDRCKTRYSIGDDRVRGKILKIRCKNCANVITVREGMTDADAGAAEAGGPRRNAKPTTLAPPVAAAAPSTVPGNGAPAGALGAAFASAMTRPPPALEEEWYVSIDGDQAGPFSLAEAQRWISAKTFDADLHCWSEGFDDWLPVDKVSHFRGLRKKPARAAAPPPLPRATGGVPALRAQTRQIVEEEPKPLFAATMASLERNVAAQAAPAGLGLPPLGNGGGRPTSTPQRGESRYPSPLGGTPALPSIQAKTNGTGPAKVPMITPSPASPVSNKSGPAPRLETRPGVGNAFDVGDQATQIEAPAFGAEAQTPAEPVASQAKQNDAFVRALGKDSGSARAVATPAPTPKLANAPITDESEDDDEDDGLSIGEVSRVVKLADLMRPAAKKPEALATAGRRTQSSPSLARTGAVVRMGNTATVARIEDPNAPANAFAPGADPSIAPGAEMAMQPAPAETSHKKGMIILIGAATAVLAGVIIAVVMLAGGVDNIDKGLGHSEGIDTTRPDDPLRPRLPGETGTGSAGPVNPFFPPKPPIKRPNGNNTVTQPNGSNTVTGPDVALGDSLSPEDIDTVSKKYSTGTQRCYMRSQKGTDAITIGAVKSIQATLTVGKDGAVTDVALGSHNDDTLGKCLSQALHGWRFRANPGGRVKFTLAFAQQ